MRLFPGVPVQHASGVKRRCLLSLLILVAEHILHLSNQRGRGLPHLLLLLRQWTRVTSIN